MKNVNEIESLVERFLNGETTLTEEHTLERFFRTYRAELPTMSEPLRIVARMFDEFQQERESQPTKPKPMLRRWAVAASIAALFCLSVAAATITYHVVKEIASSESVGAGLVSARGYEPNGKISAETSSPGRTQGPPLQENGDIDNPEKLLPEDITFKNQTLAEIARQITAIYGCKVEIADQETAALRLYFNFPKGSTAKDFVKIINDYETLAATIDGNTITIKRQEQ